jgi:tRNA threonylcarbamoyladenosine biosynthesis protein TsaB
MIRVAIETATSSGSVAVARGDHVLAEATLGDQRRHAEAVLPALESVLSEAGLERRHIEEVVVGAGPGSFTGVRVAAATAKGLAAALSVPLVAYSSLLALAAAARSDRPVCALFDARRGEVYAGCWRVSGGRIEPLLTPRVGPLDSVVAATRSWTPRPLFAGDGARRYADTLSEFGAESGAESGAEPGAESGAEPGAESGAGAGSDVPSHPRASTLLWLAAHHRGHGQVDDAAAWEPLYVRGSSAERGIAG